MTIKGSFQTTIWQEKDRSKVRASTAALPGDITVEQHGMFEIAARNYFGHARILLHRDEAIQLANALLVVTGERT